jgi:hypothetical protein
VEWIAGCTLGIVGTLITQRVLADRLELGYNIVTSPVLDPLVPDGDRFSLNIGDSTIQSPFFSTATITNSGNVHLDSVQVYLEVNARIVSFYVASDRNALRQATQWRIAENGQGAYVQCPPLNRGATISFVVVHEGMPSQQVTLDSVDRGVVLSKIDHSASLGVRLGTVALAGLMGLLTGTAAATATESPLLIRRLKSKRKTRSSSLRHETDSMCK